MIGGMFNLIRNKKWLQQDLHADERPRDAFCATDDEVQHPLTPGS